MSLPNQVVMPGDGAPTTFTIPGTTRSYTCAAGAAISVVGEDAFELRNAGWVGLAPGAAFQGAGTTTNRPTLQKGNIGSYYIDTTLNIVIVYGGPVSGWLNAATGVSS